MRLVVCPLEPGARGGGVDACTGFERQLRTGRGGATPAAAPPPVPLEPPREVPATDLSGSPAPESEETL